MYLNVCVQWKCCVRDGCGSLLCQTEGRQKLSVQLFRFPLPFVKNSGKASGTFVCPCLFNNDIFECETWVVVVVVVVFNKYTKNIHIYIYLNVARKLCTEICKKCHLHRCYCRLTHPGNRMINSLAQKFSNISTAVQLNGIKQLECFTDNFFALN